MADFLRAALSEPTQFLRSATVLAVLLATAGFAGAQTRVALKSASPSGSGAATSIVPAPSRPTWTELTLSQRQALAPLAPHWDSLTENHKRKWLAISRNFNSWPADEQARIHGRMSAWAGLSTTERDQARLNFNEARKVDPDEKKARWEAYQALSDEQRDKLAAANTPKRAGVVAAARPVRSTSLVKLTPAGSDPRVSPRVGVSASEVDHNTLLPQHLPAP